MAKARCIERMEVTGGKSSEHRCVPSSEADIGGLVWLKAQDLACVLGLKLQTIYNRVSAAPETLPPITWRPGYRGPRWSRTAVAEWQAQFNPPSLLDAPRRRGRPSKLDEIARRKVQSALGRR
jgi:hypothetical protein